MAGHSKWSNIKFRKAAQDAKRSKVITRLIREITSAVRSLGANPDNNPRLRAAVEQAKANNVSSEAINRAINRGRADANNDPILDLCYECYLDGIALMINCSSDNRNRAYASIRQVANKHKANLVSQGSVGFLFQHVGRCLVSGKENCALEAAIAANADLSQSNIIDTWEITTASNGLNELLIAIQALPELEILESEIAWRPVEKIKVSATQAAELENFIAALEELEEVTEIAHNADLIVDQNLRSI